MKRFVQRFLVVLATTAIISVTLSGVASAATPGAPTSVAAAPKDKSVTLTWTASTNTPTDYIIHYSTDAWTSWTLFYDGVASTEVAATVTGAACARRPRGGRDTAQTIGCRVECKACSEGTAKGPVPRIIIRMLSSQLL